MFDPQRLLGTLLNTGVSSSSSNFLTRSLGVPGGAAGLALLGGLAVGAFEHFSQKRQQAPTLPGSAGMPPPQAPPSLGSTSISAATPPPPPPGGLNTAAVPPPPPATLPPLPVATETAPPPIPTESVPSPSETDIGNANQQATILIRAMISAAKADGVIDADERQKILDRLADASLEEQNFVLTEMEKPLDLDALLSDIQTAKLEATQVYTASLLAIELDTSAEVKYLKALSRGLGIAQVTVNDIHRQIGAVQIFA